MIHLETRYDPQGDTSLSTTTMLHRGHEVTSLQREGCSGLAPWTVSAEPVGSGAEFLVAASLNIADRSATQDFITAIEDDGLARRGDWTAILQQGDMGRTLP